MEYIVLTLLSLLIITMYKYKKTYDEKSSIINRVLFENEVFHKELTFTRIERDNLLRKLNPKKLVVKFKYLYKDEQGWFETERYLKDPDEFRKYYSAKEYVRLDHCFIEEVEE